MYVSIDRPVNTSLVVSPQNPLLNEEITLSCSAVGKPNVITYRFFISQTYIGNSTSGNFSVNANNCSRHNGNYRCVPVNAQGEGKEKQELVVVKGMLWPHCQSELLNSRCILQSLQNRSYSPIETKQFF